MCMHGCTLSLGWTGQDSCTAIHGHCCMCAFNRTHHVALVHCKLRGCVYDITKGESTGWILNHSYPSRGYRQLHGHRCMRACAAPQTVHRSVCSCCAYQDLNCACLQCMGLASWRMARAGSCVHAPDLPCCRAPIMDLASARALSNPRSFSGNALMTPSVSRTLAAATSTRSRGVRVPCRRADTASHALSCHGSLATTVRAYIIHQITIAIQHPHNTPETLIPHT